MVQQRNTDPLLTLTFLRHGVRSKCPFPTRFIHKTHPLGQPRSNDRGMRTLPTADTPGYPWRWKRRTRSGNIYTPTDTIPKRTITLFQPTKPVQITRRGSRSRRRSNLKFPPPLNHTKEPPDVILPRLE